MTIHVWRSRRTRLLSMIRNLLCDYLWIGSVCGPCDERFIGSFLIALQVWWMCNGRDDALLLFKGTSKNASRRGWQMFRFLNWVFIHSWKVYFSLGFFLSTSYNWIIKTSRLFGLILLRLKLFPKIPPSKPRFWSRPTYISRECSSYWTWRSVHSTMHHVLFQGID